jgi:hypothetical protein
VATAITHVLEMNVWDQLEQIAMLVQTRTQDDEEDREGEALTEIKRTL